MIMIFGSAASQTIDSRIAPAIVFLLALLLFSINLNRPPHPDELHHVLAAQQLLETGHPIIGEGEYQRGILHTWFVAISYKVFGEGLASARIPAVLFVALVAPILFLWVRREAGFLAAALASSLFILSPFTVEIAQFSRFYALQMFSFFFGSLCIYYVVIGEFSITRRVFLGILAIAFMALAYFHQVTTLVGIVGVAVWTFGLVVRRVYFGQMTNTTLRRGLSLALILVGVLVILAVTLTDGFESAWERYRFTQLFNADKQNEFWFYHIRFLLYYPTLWTLVGPLAIFSIVRSPKFAWFAISIFSISFVLMSFAGTKNTRYLSFAPPFLAIVWGVGLAYVLPSLWRYLEGTRTVFINTFAMSPRLNSIGGSTAVALAISILLLTNPFWLRTATIIANVSMPFETPATDWDAAREALTPWVEDAGIMITTEELGAIYYLGRSDVRFSPSKIRELAPDQRKEFGIDHRTGRPIITKPESLEQLIECFPSGLVVGPIEHWGKQILISEAVQAVIKKHAGPIEVPEESHLYAWGWDREPRDSESGYCSDLHRFSGRPSE